MSRNNQYLFYINNTSLKIRDLISKSKEISFKDVTRPSYICLSNQQEEVAIVTASGQFAVYNFITNEKILIDKRSKHETCNIKFSPDDKYLITGDWNGNIYMLDKKNIKVSLLMTINNSMIVNINSINDTFYFLITPKADLESGKIEKKISLLQWKYPFQQDYEIINFDFYSSNMICTKNEFIIIDNHFDKELNVYDISKNKIKSKLKFNDAIEYFTLSNNLKYLSVISNKKVCLYQFNSLKPICNYSLNYPCYVNFSDDSKYILIGSWESGLVLEVEEFIRQTKVTSD